MRAPERASDTADDAGPHAQPDRLGEDPPAEQFCDLVMNGGVASGVVYPWALLELARHYRFKNIGGNSVGAMAAAVAAAAEYGRCNGVEDAFEPLRRMPLKLAEEQNGKTKMLRLFQPSPPVARLFELFLTVVRWSSPEPEPPAAEESEPNKPAEPPPKGCKPRKPDDPATNGALPRKPPDPNPWVLLCRVLRLYGLWFPLLVLLLLAGWAFWQVSGVGRFPLGLLALAGALLGALLLGLWLFYRDLDALSRNAYGLCTGLGQVPGEEGLVEWLHQGIQRSAGRQREDPPLTFADLWSAPRFGRPGPTPLPRGLQPEDPGISLQMFTSNVTQGRPVRLPLNDANTRLYYLPEEWAAYFPPSVMAALYQASSPYQPASRSDPETADLPRPLSPADAVHERLMNSLRELPSGGMPIVVAARLSLCFPLLFSCVPVYAVDYEAPKQDRRLRRCLLSDGGLCTNFPIHLFDAAHPQWPTFALLLDKRLTRFDKQNLWLPELHLDGRGDNWQRFVPGAEEDGKAPRSLLLRVFGLAGGMLLTMKDWNDRMTGRLPQVRNRIVRLALQQGEGQLNLPMPRKTILRMAHQYGTQAGKTLVASFAPDGNRLKPAWREHVYVRSMIELRALRQHLRGYARAVQSMGSTEPLCQVLEQAAADCPLRKHPDRPDPTADRLSEAQRAALHRAVEAIKTLEAALSACEGQFGPYQPVLEPEIRLRPPL